jgi:hypothetical protein
MAADHFHVRTYGSTGRTPVPDGLFQGQVASEQEAIAKAREVAQVVADAMGAEVESNTGRRHPLDSRYQHLGAVGARPCPRTAQFVGQLLPVLLNLSQVAHAFGEFDGVAPREGDPAGCQSGLVAEPRRPVASCPIFRAHFRRTSI